MPAPFPPHTHKGYLPFFTAEEYIYLSDIKTYSDANKFCQDRGYLHLAVMDTDVRQNMFSIAMAIEQDE